MPGPRSSTKSNLPRLSPSRINTFLGCPMKYRFQYVDSIPKLPVEVALRGNFTHRILELLLQRPAQQRTTDAARSAFDQAQKEFLNDDEFRLLALDPDATEAFWEAAREAVRAYYRIEHPQDADIVALEKWVSARLGDFEIGGYIDRLERDQGRLVVSDYKGAVPKRPEYATDNFRQLMLYALMCQVQLEQTPHEVRVYYLGGGRDEYPRNRRVVSREVTPEALDEVRTAARQVFDDLNAATASGEFATKVQKLCDWCDYQRWCPAHGGDPSVAHAESSVAVNIRRKAVGLAPLA
jgi:putative RecB family exonuclease